MSKNSKKRRQLAAAKAHRQSKPGPAKTKPLHGKTNTWYNKLKGTAPVGPTKPAKQEDTNTEE